jgi:hypothetical protein
MKRFIHHESKVPIGTMEAEAYIAQIDLLLAQVADLRARLERSDYAVYTEGFEAAGRLIGKAAKTIRLKLQMGNYPKPVRIDKINTRKRIRLKPIWRTSDLLAWAESRQAA